MYIFAYGSLINLISASKAIGHSLDHSSVMTVKLTGYRRTWDLVETVYSDDLKKNINAVFLNLTKYPGMFVNGILIPITKHELSSIAKREKNYDMVNVSEHICFSARSNDEKILTSEVYTAISKDEYKIKEKDDAFFLINYEQLVVSGVKSFGGSFTKEYIDTTEISNLKRIAGSYKFVDPLQNSLA